MRTRKFRDELLETKQHLSFKVDLPLLNDNRSSIKCPTTHQVRALGNQIHHLIPKSLADDKVLVYAGISVHHPDNLMYLPDNIGSFILDNNELAVHQGPHPKNYFTFVRAQLIDLERVRLLLGWDQSMVRARLIVIMSMLQSKSQSVE